MKNSRLPLLLLVLLLVVAAAVFFTRFEYYEEQIDGGWGPKALSNPLLAAQLYLQQSGVSVASPGRSELWSNLQNTDTLIVTDIDFVVSEQRAQQLIDWIKAGGHLITAAPYRGEGRRDNPILNYFSVQRYEGTYLDPDEPATESDLERERETGSGKDKETAEDSDSEKLSDQLREINQRIEAGEDPFGPDSPFQSDLKNNQAAIPEWKLTPLEFQGTDEQLKVHFYARSTLYHSALAKQEEDEWSESDPFYWTGSSAGTHFMQLDAGAGMLSLLSDMSIWRSRRIGDFDHAYLLQILTDGGDQVVMLHGIDMPALTTLIWRYAPELLIGGLLWLGAWLAFRSRRFGPIIELPIGQRRAISEHLSASGEYLWRQQHAQRLLNVLYQDIEQAAQRARHDFKQLEQPQRHRWLAQHCGLTVRQIDEALSAPAPRREEDFLLRIQRLQSLRNAL